MQSASDNGSYLSSASQLRTRPRRMGKQSGESVGESARPPPS